MVTTTETPGGAGCPSGTEDRRETIGKLVTVVPQEVVFSILTAVVPGTPLDAIETQTTVACRRAFSTWGTPVAIESACSNDSIWVTFGERIV